MGPRGHSDSDSLHLGWSPRICIFIYPQLILLYMVYALPCRKYCPVTPIPDLPGEGKVFQSLPEQKEEVAAVITAGRHISQHLFICCVAKPSVSTP